MNEAQGQAWLDAQALPITVDLVAAANEELLMLEEVDRLQCLYEGPVVVRAIERYERCWLPLLAKEGVGSQDQLIPLIPPLDCAWIWHVHRLNPIRYAKDCKELYGRILDAPIINPLDKESAIKRTKDLWSTLYVDESYNIEFGLTDEKSSHEQEIGAISSGLKQLEIPSDLRKITYDLEAAVSRQKTFFYQVSQPFVRTESYLKSAEQRYKGFLYLFTLNKGLFLVPTYDVDIMWHAHQLSPAAYNRDCLAILKRVLNHDDTDSDRGPGQKLNTGFKDTCELWEEIFGTMYPKAGCMWRGDLPVPVEPPTVDKNASFDNTSVSLSVQEQHTYLSQRQTVQVCLALLGAKDVPIKKAGPTLFVRAKLLQKCPSFKLDTYEVPTYSDTVWRQIYTLKFDSSTEGLLLQLRSTSSGIFSTGSKLLGEVALTWKTLLSSPTLSVKEWFSLRKGKSLVSSALHVSASITPPVAAPYLLRTLKTGQDRVLKDGSNYEFRNVFDHVDQERLMVCIQHGNGDPPKVGPFSTQEVQVLQSAQKEWRFSKNEMNPGTLLARAQPLVKSDPGYPDASNVRQWQLFDNDIQLTIRRKPEDNQWHLRPELRLEGNVGYPVALVSGRRLDYQVNGASPEEEAGFVTLVRYTPDTPSGKATALFNTSSGAMEVKPEESVPLVVLLSTVISISLVEMLGKSRPQISKTGRNKARASGNEWGAVIFERQANEKSDIARKMALYNSLNYHYWWDMPFVFWCASFYNNASLLSDTTANQYAGL
ncbi:hypothetical protein KC19_8G192000 [Ceratodon purpureus]|uniref:Glycine-rich domain-containing protein 1 n=1 Tax=Ceratodon purpureus TaxID=3225 RepID=A0A8T0H036_CERPU|nr:hypothetical protein KC19_8G192000 [Ceratodon purpureus]